MVRKMSYVDALLFIADQVYCTHLSVRKAYQGAKLYSLSLADCEIKDNPSEPILTSVSGYGETIEDAAEEYFHKLEGKFLVFNAMKSHRFETYFDDQFSKYKEHLRKS